MWIGAGYGSAGERCMAISVAVPVGKKTGDALVEKLIPRVESLKIGPSSDAQADYGPMVTKELLGKVRGYIDSGIKEGAKLVVDGRGFKLQGYENGNFIGGCLFDEVRPNMKIYKEEIFGPVLSVVRAKDYEEAVRLPSEHDYGNGVAIFTRDGDTARDFVNRVQVGMVGVNFAIPVPLAYYTFGGWKRSGFGDLNQHGPDSVRGGCPGKFFTSRHWTLAQGALSINDDENQPLARFSFASGHYEGRATTGMPVSLTRQIIEPQESQCPITSFTASPSPATADRAALMLNLIGAKWRAGLDRLLRLAAVQPHADDSDREGVNEMGEVPVLVRRRRKG